MMSENERAHLPGPLGPYKPLRLLGDGGMGEVYLAEKSDANQVRTLVALKLIRLDLVNNPHFFTAFANEARICGRLNHDHIVRLHDYDDGPRYGRPYLVMEFVDGVTLKQLITRCHGQGTTLPLNVVLQIAIQVADTLHYIHTAKDWDGRLLHLVHRDIKPSNILLSRSGHVKIADFGIARSSCNDSLTRHGEVKGTSLYMSPEQATGALLDHRSDLFSFGLVLYEMLEGKRVFQETRTTTHRDREMVAEAFQALKLRGYPPVLLEVMRSLLAYSPNDRTPSADEAASKLRAVQHALNDKHPEIPLHRWLDSQLGPPSLELVRVDELILETSEPYDSGAEAGTNATPQSQGSGSPLHRQQLLSPGPVTNLSGSARTPATSPRLEDHWNMIESLKTRSGNESSDMSLDGPPVTSTGGSAPENPGPRPQGSADAANVGSASALNRIGAPLETRVDSNLNDGRGNSGAETPSPADLAPKESDGTDVWRGPSPIATPTNKGWIPAPLGCILAPLTAALLLSAGAGVWYWSLGQQLISTVWPLETPALTAQLPEISASTPSLDTSLTEAAPPPSANAPTPAHSPATEDASPNTGAVGPTPVDAHSQKEGTKRAPHGKRPRPPPKPTPTPAPASASAAEARSTLHLISKRNLYSVMVDGVAMAEKVDQDGMALKLLPGNHTFTFQLVQKGGASTASSGLFEQTLSVKANENQDCYIIVREGGNLWPAIECKPKLIRQ